MLIYASFHGKNACFQDKSRRLASGYLRNYISRTTSHTHLQLKKAFVVETFCTLYVCTAVLQCSTTFVLNLWAQQEWVCILLCDYLLVTWVCDYLLVTWDENVSICWSCESMLVMWVYAGHVSLCWSCEYMLVMWVYAGHVSLCWSCESMLVMWIYGTRMHDCK